MNEIDELVKRLRDGSNFYHAPTTWNEAADTLESLSSEIARLAKELEEARKDANLLDHLSSMDGGEIYHLLGDYDGFSKDVLRSIIDASRQQQDSKDSDEHR